MKSNKIILPILVIAQFCCVSLWFAGNAVMVDLSTTYNLPFGFGSHLSSSVQFGFILGTLILALFSITDIFSPSKVFFIFAILGATFNTLTLLENHNIYSLLILRFLVGFSLAGIYPIGMKIAADYYEKGLGKSLGFLVGALVLGTAFPHLLKTFSNIFSFSWQSVLIFSSILAIMGGLLVRFFIPDGPHRVSGKALEIKKINQIFKSKDFRISAFGYFGHMWELYAFWAFLPFILNHANEINPHWNLNISLWSFLIIGIGCLSCIAGAYLSSFKGLKSTAYFTLFLSLSCCILSPVVFYFTSLEYFLLFFLFWGAVVIADSPLFSTLVAQNVSPDIKGSALTLVNCIGFSITIVSIQLMQWLSDTLPSNYLLLILAIGPFFGWYYNKTSR